MSASLAGFLDTVADRRRTITVYGPESCDALESQFETRNVTVEHERLPDDGSDGFVVVTADEEFLGSIGSGAIRHLVSPSSRELGSEVEESVNALLVLLADTTFVSFDKRQLLMAAREFEDRAYRCGSGTLRTGFQSLSALRPQRESYTLLGAESLLDVHVYGEPDWSPNLSNVTYHAEKAAEIGRFWFVVFDGGSDDGQACALLAEEDDGSGHFHGFWTYDPELVADIDAYLRKTYG